MEQLIELLKQIQELAGVAIDALEGASESGGKPGGEGPPPEGGPEKGGPEGGPGGGPESGPPPEEKMPPGK